jgi:hypothetical protein
MRGNVDRRKHQVARAVGLAMGAVIVTGDDLATCEG